MEKVNTKMRVMRKSINFAVAVMLVLPALSYSKKRPSLPDELKDRYLAGLQYVRSGDFASAVSEFHWLLNQAEVQRIPYYHAKVLYWLAESLFSLEKYPEAYRYYLELMDTYPQSKLVESATYGAGKSAYLSADYTNAVKYLSLYIARYDNVFSREDDALFYLGKSYLSLGDKMRAIELFKQLVSRYPSSPYTYEIRGTLEDLRKEGIERSMTLSNKMVELISKESNIVETEQKLAQLKEELKRERQKVEVEKAALEQLFKLLEQKERLLKLKEKKLKALELMGFGRVK